MQIWTLRSREHEGSVGEATAKSREPGEVNCEMVLCLDSGPAQELKWCPLPAHDRVCYPVLSLVADSNALIQWDIGRQIDTPRKLGILAGTFEDGSLSVYVVPDPGDINHPQKDPSLPVFGMVSLPPGHTVINFGQ